jgi:hypothetical protein
MRGVFLPLIFWCLKMGENGGFGMLHLVGFNTDENGGAKIDHGSGGDVPSAGGVKLSHL